MNTELIKQAATGELTYIKYGLFAGLAFYVIKNLLDIVRGQLNKKNIPAPAAESASKETSRVSIQNIETEVKQINHCLKDREDSYFEMYNKVNVLHKWHDKTDEDGVPVWYVRRSLEDAIIKLGESIDNQTKVFTKLSIKLEK